MWKTGEYKCQTGIVVGDLGDGAYRYSWVLDSDKINVEKIKLKVRQHN